MTQTTPTRPKKKACAVPSKATRIKIGDFSFCSNYLKNIYTCTQGKLITGLLNGPSSIGIDGKAIKLYKSGVYTGSCKEDNHAVILVGYGVEGSQEYFKIRNSWGTSWGENGYIKIARNPTNNNSCFTQNESYAVTMP